VASRASGDTGSASSTGISSPTAESGDSGKTGGSGDARSEIALGVQAAAVANNSSTRKLGSPLSGNVGSATAIKGTEKVDGTTETGNTGDSGRTGDATAIGGAVSQANSGAWSNAQSTSGDTGDVANDTRVRAFGGFGGDGGDNARARSRRGGELVIDVAGEKFGRGIDALELRQVIEVLVAKRLERGVQHLLGTTDVDNDAVAIKLFSEKGGAHDKSRPVKLLRRPKNLPAKGMRDHDLAGNFNGIHDHLLFS